MMQLTYSFFQVYALGKQFVLPLQLQCLVKRMNCHIWCSKGKHSGYGMAYPLCEFLSQPTKDPPSCFESTTKDLWH